MFVSASQLVSVHTRQWLGIYGEMCWTGARSFGAIEVVPTLERQYKKLHYFLNGLYSLDFNTLA